MLPKKTFLLSLNNESSYKNSISNNLKRLKSYFSIELIKKSKHGKSIHCWISSVTCYSLGWNKTFWRILRRSTKFIGALQSNWNLNFNFPAKTLFSLTPYPQLKSVVLQRYFRGYSHFMRSITKEILTDNYKLPSPQWKLTKWCDRKQWSKTSVLDASRYWLFVLSDEIDGVEAEDGHCLQWFRKNGFLGCFFSEDPPEVMKTD